MVLYNLLVIMFKYFLCTKWKQIKIVKISESDIDKDRFLWRFSALS